VQRKIKHLKAKVQPKKIVLLQVRTDSKRLPKKCLYPILGISSILILYRRIICKEYKTIILTSNNKSDDYLVKILRENNIFFFRGDLKNVYKRFIDSCKNFNDQDIIIRITADNLFLDKYFLKDLFKEFLKKSFKYGYVDRNKSKLPLGLGAEIFRLKTLRSFKPRNYFDKEHVTPQIRRKLKNIGRYKIFSGIDCFNKNCTLDNIQDYFKIKSLFEKNKKIKILWKDLCKKLKFYKNNLNHSSYKKNFNKIIIGTAQFGMKYGISNNHKIKIDDIKKILYLAEKIGINNIDTANSYGNSEKLIGKYIKKKNLNFNIFTKSKLSEHDINNKNSLSLFAKNLKNSKKLIGNKHLKGFLVHNPQFYIKNKFFFDKEFKKSDINLGISLNQPSEFKKLSRKIFSFYQFPFNILDRRWDFILKNKIKKKKYFFKNIFLKNLYFLNKKKILKIFKKKFLKIKKKLNFFVKKFNRYDLKDLLINFVRSYKSIDGIVIGLNSFSQFKELFFYFYQKPISKMQRKILIKSLSVDQNIISPYKWRLSTK